ncbi:hypothetical protein LuPra_03502 [Luteitalea pratensis]|uniref:Uncharacterized protein n=1 Tax=Luteitalea pratensis TaxID=1855912 RepID=A0A143PNS7_LUTPR|nr:hypothetical protein [Luteitalea pratensis]AMY10272.1 hypothetical protein LuPra_03502 [Luteitalea pratensis]
MRDRHVPRILSAATLIAMLASRAGLAGAQPATPPAAPARDGSAMHVNTDATFLRGAPSVRGPVLVGAPLGK